MGVGQKQRNKTAIVEFQDSGRLEEGRFFGGGGSWVLDSIGKISGALKPHCLPTYFRGWSWSLFYIK